MNTKLIFVGPSGSGKTTLRKVFFEGENSSNLLEYALEPTYGEESLIVKLPRLNKDIGIFDLAGQENQRWLDSEERSIFNNATLILVVIDITLGLDYIEEFVKKITKIRNLLTESTMIYVLIHKIDLVSQNDLKKINSGVINTFSNEKSIGFMFTSLKQPFYTQTLSYFIEIIKNCFKDETADEGLMFNVIDESLKIINQIDEDLTISKNTLKDKLNMPEKLLDYLIEHLILKDHIQISKIKNKEVLSLTDKGRLNFKNVIRQFSSEGNTSYATEPIQNQIGSVENVPPFIGAIIADKSGKLLLKIELFENALEKYLLNKEPNDKNNTVDLELIPMFMSAIEKFSLQINIDDLTGFNLEGNNLKMQIYGYDIFTVIVFTNPNINLKPISNKIINFFNDLFKDYPVEFENAVKAGKIDSLFPLQEIGKDWLKNLNQSYRDLIINLEIYDIEQAKSLYTKIDDIYNKVETEFSILLEKIKKMKVNLMAAITEEDFEELRKIAKLTQELSSEFTLEI